MDKKITIALLEHTGSEFYTSRLGLGIFLMKNGYKVIALIPSNTIPSVSQKIQSQNIDVELYPYERNSRKLFSNITTLKVIHAIFYDNKIDLIHSFKFQPNFYAVLSNLFSKKKIILHITGLGIAFSESGFKYKVLKYFSLLIFFFNFSRAQKIIFQNPEDILDIFFTPIFTKKIHLIKGSGVDLEKFNKNLYNKFQSREQNQIPKNSIVLTLVSRLLWSKGIKEAVESVQNLSKSFPKLLLLIIGSPDGNNPESVSKEYIESFKNDPNIKFLGKRENISELLALSDIYLYPSYYREGVPRSVLEALSTGLPIITTDMPGCRLTVKEGINGYLIKPRSVEDIEKAICNMIQNSPQWEGMGLNSRELAKNEFSNEIIYQKILEVYTDL